MIELIKSDITSLKVDAIVNAANKSLLGGGGVDGAIHRVAGKQLLEECRSLNGCEIGEAKITLGYNLPAKYVIHTVGPIWHGGKKNEENLLTNAYKNCLKLAQEENIKSIAFPCISTGVYRFPKEKATEIAVNTVKDFLKNTDKEIKVIFCVFSDEDYSLYEEQIKI